MAEETSSQLYSMTGFGTAHRMCGSFEARVEAKSVNGRSLKLSLKIPSWVGAREQELEGLCRGKLRRGTVTLLLSCRGGDELRGVRVNEARVRFYQTTFRRLGIPEGPLALLPGVIEEVSQEEGIGDKEWQSALDAAQEALENLVAHRAREGERLAAGLIPICDRAAETIKQVGLRAPAVVEEYQLKLQARVQALLGEGAASVPDELLAREVALCADRSDVTEELDRLAAHVQEARWLLSRGGEVGRALEFLSQEMLRETNTIGAKSTDKEISRLVVQLKGDIDRLREQFANFE